MPLRVRPEILQSAPCTTDDINVACNSGECDSDGNQPSIEQIVRECPFTVDEAWAMEEYLRLTDRHRGIDQWYGTHIPPEVWGPPGTPECPFHTASADFQSKR